MIIGYLILLLGVPSVGYGIYLAIDWMIKNFNTSAWIMAGIVWFIMCTLVGIVIEHDQ